MMQVALQLPDASTFGYACMGFAFLACLYRVIRGPRLPDRLVALDLASITAIGVLAIRARSADTAAMLDVGIIIALISFLGVVAFAHYLSRGGED